MNPCSTLIFNITLIQTLQMLSRLGLVSSVTLRQVAPAITLQQRGIKGFNYMMVDPYDADEVTVEGM